ncbi:hypothetical protein Taro_028895, partial [Colocasia esculenta]|nr:hypothetical protein [Colocasia esculenta]
GTIRSTSRPPPTPSTVYSEEIGDFGLFTQRERERENEPARARARAREVERKMEVDSRGEMKDGGVLGFPYWVVARRKLEPHDPFFMAGNHEREFLAKQVALDLTEDEKSQLQSIEDVEGQYVLLQACIAIILLCILKFLCKDLSSFSFLIIEEYDVSQARVLAGLRDIGGDIRAWDRANQVQVYPDRGDEQRRRHPFGLATCRRATNIFEELWVRSLLIFSNGVESPGWKPSFSGVESLGWKPNPPPSRLTPPRSPSSSSLHVLCPASDMNIIKHFFSLILAISPP